MTATSPIFSPCRTRSPPASRLPSCPAWSAASATAPRASRPTDAIGHAALAHVLQASGRYDEASAAADLAVNLDPNSAWALGAQGYARSFGNRPQEAIESLKAAMRLSPFDPQMSRWLNHLSR